MPMLVDASPLVAAAVVEERGHSLAAALLRDLPGPLIVPATVLTEADHLIRQRAGDRAAQMLLTDVVTGSFTYAVLEDADLHRSLAIIEDHPGLRLGLADASVVALAERMKVKTILTFDHRGFRRVRPSHVKAFELVPTEGELEDAIRQR